MIPLNAYCQRCIEPQTSESQHPARPYDFYSEHFPVEVIEASGTISRLFPFAIMMFDPSKIPLHSRNDPKLFLFLEALAKLAAVGVEWRPSFVIQQRKSFEYRYCGFMTE